MTLAADASGTTALDLATFAIAVLALVTATLALGWQVLTHFLTGGRIKAEMLVGALHASGDNMVTAEATQERASGKWLPELAGQGYVTPIFGVRVRNIGRLPVTVESWGLKTSPGSIGVTPVGLSSGSALPHRLEAGTSETWVMEAAPVFNLAAATKETSNYDAVNIFGTVELADGRKYETPQRLRF